MNELENTELCKKCGGRCCKNGGCLWFPSDFKFITLNFIDEFLKSVNVSFVGTHNVTFNGYIPVFNGVTLSLRARNVSRGPIDLVSIPTQCVSLGVNGCEYDFEHRPSGGKHLVPTPDLGCYEDFDIANIEKEWSKYNKILSRLVRRYTGNSVVDEYKRQVMEYLYTWATIPLEEIPTFRAQELQDVTNMFLMLFPKEASIANERVRAEKNNVLRKSL